MNKVLAFILIIFCVVNCKDVTNQIEIDRCLDNGGFWDTVKDSCIYSIESFISFEESSFQQYVIELVAIYEKAKLTSRKGRYK